MQTKRFIGENPKVGIRPVIDGRQGGVRESLEEQTMNMAGRVAELITSTLKYTDGTPVQCVIADTTIGRVPRGCRLRREVPQGGRRAHYHRYPVLVLRQRNDRLRTTACPKLFGVLTAPSAPAQFTSPQHWPATPRKECPHSAFTATTCRTPTTQTIPDDVKEKLLRLHARRPGRRADARQELPFHGLGRDGYRRFHRRIPTSSRPTWACATSRSTCARFIRRSNEGIYDHEEFEKAMAWTEKTASTVGQDCNPADSSTAAPRQARGLLEVHRQDDDHDRPRPDDRQSDAWREMGFEEEAAGTTPSPRASRASASGPTTSPTATSLESMLNSQLRLERHPRALRGGDRERFAQRRGDALRQPADRHARRSSPTCAPTGAPRLWSA